MTIAAKYGVSPGCKITYGDICAFESMYGYRLPADYREFQLEMNGANFSTTSRYYFPLRAAWLHEHKILPHVFPPLSWPPKGDVFMELVASPTVLQSICSEDEFHRLSTHSKYYNFKDKLPRELLLIGFTTLNDVICLGCGGSFHNRVYHWNTLMGTPDLDAADAMRGLSEVADSFLQFWSDLVEVSDNDIIH